MAALRLVSSLTCSISRSSRSFCSTTKSSSSQLSGVFDAWCRKYEKTYPSEQEKQYRFKVFQENYKFITKHNKECLKSSRRMALNDLTDITNQEFAAKYLRYKLNEGDVTIKSGNWRERPDNYKPFGAFPDIFDSWCKKFRKEYDSEEEERYHREAFKKNYRCIIEHNGSDAVASHKLVINQFSDRFGGDRRS